MLFKEVEKLDNKLNIGVVFGGRSVEHEISIVSAMQIIANLDKSKYNIIPLYLTNNNEMLFGEELKTINYFQNKKTKKRRLIPVFIVRDNKNQKAVIRKVKNGKMLFIIDLAILIVHGKGVEDGTIASLFEYVNIPYTSTNPQSAAICQDKEWTKVLLREKGIKVLTELTLQKDLYNENIFLANLNCLIATSEMKYPLIVKPAHLGSSIGIKKVTSEKEAIDAIKFAFTFDNKVIIEECLENFKEFAIAVSDIPQYQLSTIEEINLKNDIYLLEDKYLKNAYNNHLTNSVIPDTLKEKMRIIAQKAYYLLELEGIVRIDYLFDPSKNNLYLNEINTIPGSLAFYLFKNEKDEIDFKILLDSLIKYTLIKHQKKNYLSFFSTNILNKTFEIGEK